MNNLRNRTKAIADETCRRFMAVHDLIIGSALGFVFSLALLSICDVRATSETALALIGAFGAVLLAYFITTISNESLKKREAQQAADLFSSFLSELGRACDDWEQTLDEHDDENAKSIVDYFISQVNDISNGLDQIFQLVARHDLKIAEGIVRIKGEIGVAVRASEDVGKISSDRRNIALGIVGKLKDTMHPYELHVAKTYWK
jgi:hypothetical protein